MQFSTKFVLLCQALGITAAALNKRASSCGCGVADGQYFGLQNTRSGAYVVSGPADEDSLAQFVDTDSPSMYRLASYKGASCLLHDSYGHVAVVSPNASPVDSVAFYKPEHIPTGSAPVNCNVFHNTGILCFAATAGINVEIADDIWMLTNTTNSGSFALSATMAPAS